jgi:hypothetical protein
VHNNYRVSRKRSEYIFNGKIKNSYEYSIVEAFYDKNGFIGMVSSEPVPLFAENIEQLARTYSKIREAFYLPILDYHNIPQPGYKESEDSLMTALNSAKFWKKLESDDIDLNIEEMEKAEKEEESERKTTEKLFHYLIKEFIHETNPCNKFKLAEFYKKKD